MSVPDMDDPAGALVRVDPVAEPGAQRRSEFERSERVVPELSPLLISRSTCFVQQLRRDAELSDIVREGAPMQEGSILDRNVHLLGNEIRIGPHPLTVTAGQPIVVVEELQQDQEILRCFICGGPEGLAIGDAPLQFPGGTGAKGELHPRRCLVGEYERHAEERCEWQQPPGEGVDHGDRCDCSDGAGSEPTEPAERAVGLREGR